jgi:lipopolysaccharide transport system ATP-binding protein
MSSIIEVRDLSKKFVISHEGKERYVSLRDEMSKKAKSIFSGSGSKDESKTEKEDFWALKDINFEVNAGDRVGIIGRNGAGKSTLLKILSRITEPSKGRITIRGRVASLLEVGTGFHPELTGRENIFLNGAILGMGRNEIRKKFDEIVAFSEVEKFLDTPVKRYSSGMYVRLAFAVAAHLEPEILIVDEVLAVGDAEFQKKCIGKMEDVSNNEGRTVLFVSHNTSALLSLCKTGILLRNGQVDSQGHIEGIVGKYMSSASNNVYYPKKYLKYVRIDQVEDHLEVECEYESDRDLDIPHLGIVIKNGLGNPIFGTNPSVHGLEKGGYKRSGKIRVSIREPKLMDGTYFASIWFGDTIENFISENDCLSFEVAAMTSQKQYNPHTVGNVLPTCEWAFL